MSTAARTSVGASATAITSSNNNNNNSNSGRTPCRKPREEVM